MTAPTTPQADSIPPVNRALEDGLEHCRSWTGFREWHGAWIHEKARLGVDVELAPGAMIGADAEIGDRCRIGPNAIVYGPTTLGQENVVHAGAVLGGAPQDLGYRDEPTRLEIGDRNTFREGFTANRGAPKAEGLTRIGSDNLFMAMSHVGHDSVVENNCVFANSVLIGGHSHVASNVNLGGGAAVAQFVSVGRFVFVGGLSAIRKDLEPFMIFDRGRDSFGVHAVGTNLVGLRRGGFDNQTIQRLKKAHRVFFRGADAEPGKSLRERARAADVLCPEVDELLAFMERKEAGRFGRQLDKPRD